jgi:hypothetical protein
MATLSLQDLQKARPALRAQLRPLAKKCTFGPAIQIYQDAPDKYTMVLSTYPNPFLMLQAKFTMTSFGKVEKLPFERAPNHFPWATLKASHVEEWADILLRPKRQEVAITLCKAMKKDLIAAAWHPRRVEKWLEAGVQLEDL